jgi:hypothetical protein
LERHHKHKHLNATTCSRCDQDAANCSPTSCRTSPTTCTTSYPCPLQLLVSCTVAADTILPPAATTMSSSSAKQTNTNTPPAKRRDVKPAPPSVRVLEPQDIKQEKMTPPKAVTNQPEDHTNQPRKRAASIARRRRQWTRVHCKYCKASPCVHAQNIEDLLFGDGEIFRIYGKKKFTDNKNHFRREMIVSEYLAKYLPPRYDPSWEGNIPSCVREAARKRFPN